MKKPVVYWIAVQPTPYNHYLYMHLKSDNTLNYKICYAGKLNAELPWVQKHFDADDSFMNESFGFDFKLLTKAIRKNNFFVLAGWNNKTKIAIILLRALLNFPFAIWTDSINPAKYANNKTWTSFKKFMLRKASFIMTTGSFGIAKMKEAKLKNDNIISLPFFVHVPQKIQPKTLAENETLQLLILSRLIKEKGIESSLEAIKILVFQHQYKNICLNIAGIGPLQSELHHYIQQNNLQSYINLLGWLNETELRAYKNKAHLLIHTVVQHDPYPLAILESLAAGIPVISTNLAGSAADNIINNYNGFIVEANNSYATAEVIQKVLKNPCMLKELSINAYNKAKQWNIKQAIASVNNQILKAYAIA